VSGATLELPPGRGELSVRFTALDLRAPDQLRFRYRLVGFDRQWVEAGERRIAFYTNLSPGRYRFEAQSRTHTSLWGEPGALFDLRLKPRFFQTWWFRSLGILVLAGLVFTAHRARVAHLERRKVELKRLVAARTRDLQEINATLERRVEDGVEALRESDRMAAYGHLVAGVAHEVRHPIFALRMASHVLAQKLEGTGYGKDELEILERETDLMNGLVDDLLELGRPRELHLVPCPPERLIDEALASVAPHPDARLELGKDISPHLPQVLADRPAVIQVLLNLLHNACRHARGATRVVVGACLDDRTERVRLSVTDDGEGIPEAQQAMVFEPFYSTGDSTGLGLAITRRIVNEHGGRLRVRSGPAGGTVFSFDLEPVDE
jgi:signal transduction histidine kinase